MGEKKKLRLGEILIAQGVLSPESLDRALELQKKEGGLLGERLIKMGLVSEEDIVLALARQYNIPYLPVQNCDVSSKLIQLVPVDLVKKYLFIPIDRINDVLTVIMADPTNEFAKKEISEATQMRLQVLVGTATEIYTAMRKYYKVRDDLLSSTDVSTTVSQVSFKKATEQKPNSAQDG